jgi:hypothetical protein
VHPLAAEEPAQDLVARDERVDAGGRRLDAASSRSGSCRAALAGEARLPGKAERTSPLLPSRTPMPATTLWTPPCRRTQDVGSVVEK